MPDWTWGVALGSILGPHEFAVRLGVSRQRLNALRRTLPYFPTPWRELKIGPIWTSEQVGEFIDQWPRKTGRPNMESEP